MQLLKDFASLLVKAGTAWSRDKASLYAAAIAYYMVFSIAPLLVFSISIAGQIFGEAAVEGQIVSQVDDFVGSEAAILLQNLLENAISGSSSFTLISSVILLWAASGVFNHLKRALDIIYGVIPKQIPGIKGILYIVRYRFISFAMVLFIGVLLLLILAFNTIINTLGNYIILYTPILSSFNADVVRFATPPIIFVFFIIVFKMLPEARVAWGDVIIGSILTTVLILLGVYLIGIYLNYTNVGSVYGAASSLIVILVWIYYSAQIVMFGGEFVKVYANNHGRYIVPRSNATYLAVHYNNVLPEIAQEPQPEPEEPSKVIFGEDGRLEAGPPPTGGRRKQIAAAFLGLATGLFLAFIGQFLQDE